MGLTSIKEVVIYRVGPHHVVRDPLEMEDQDHYHMVIHSTIHPISMVSVSQKTKEEMDLLMPLIIQGDQLNSDLLLMKV